MSTSRPNVVFLIMDDQRFDAIAALGNTEISTPNLDYLCRRGVAFRNAYMMGGCDPAVCMPSRAIYHTGRGPYQIQGSGEVIPSEHRTMGEHLQEHGYETWATGKWHNDPDSFVRSFQGGANIFFGGMDNHWNMPVCDYRPDGAFPAPAEHTWNPGTGERQQVPQRFDRYARGTHSTELFASSAIEFLHSWSGENPFFLYAAFTAPHDPRTAPREFHSMYDPDAIHEFGNVLPEHPFDNGELDVRDEHLVSHPYTASKARKEIADYYAMISHYDHWLGRIIDALQAADALENTIIVHTGDHGLSLGNHGLMGKQNLYEDSIRVPLIMSGPGIPEGETRDALVVNTDMFPTMCSLLELPVPETVVGKSYHESILNPDTPHRDYVMCGYRDVQRSVREGRYKLIEYCVGSQRTTQLFDIQEDPNETHDLSSDATYSETLRSMRRTLKRAREEWEDESESFWSGFPE